MKKNIFNNIVLAAIVLLGVSLIPQPTFAETNGIQVVSSQSDKAVFQ